MRIIRFIGVACVIGLFFLCIVAIDEVGEHPDKIWLHRCNSMEKLYEHSERYSNFEVDIVFRQDSVFDVTHDIDTSFNLSIEPYFGYIQQNGGKLWLDIKNLDLQNVSAMLTQLADLTSRYDIDKERWSIESRNWQALQRFTEEGYYTSLYIGWENPSRLESEEIDSYMDKLRKAVDHKIVHALSFPGWWYSTIKENLNRSIDLLTWKHRTTQWQLLLTPKGHKMLDDPELKVILVKDKGQYHR